MRRVLLLLLPIVLASTAAGAGIDIGVDPSAAGELLLVGGQDGTPAATVEARNPGSVPLTGRVRMDVMANGTRIFRAWSTPVVLQPGAAAARTLAYTGPAANATYTAEIRLHYGANVTPPVTRSITPPRATADRFRLTAVRASSRAVRVDVVAPDNVDRMHVTVDGPGTRRFAQRTVDQGAGSVRVPYHPRLRGPTDLRVTVMDADGAYRSTRTVTVTPADGIVAGMRSMLDTLRLRFHMVLT